MLYINELYYLREFNEIELKIKNVISKIKLAENIFFLQLKNIQILLYYIVVIFLIVFSKKTKVILL